MNFVQLWLKCLKVKLKLLGCPEIGLSDDPAGLLEMKPEFINTVIN